MKALSRDARLVIIILASLLVIIVFAVMQRRGEDQYARLSSLSNAPNGARALKLWMQELKYDVDESVVEAFVPSGDTSIVLMLEPIFPTEGEMDAMDQWLEEGGTLIAIGEQYGMLSLIEHYGFGFYYLADEEGTLSNETPLLDSPSALDLNNVTTHIALTSERDDFVTLASYQNQPVLVSFEQGKGRVILGTLSDPFTNAGLKLSGNPELVLNVLALAKEKGRVWFDEWHHGLRGGTQLSGPSDFLQRTPVGHALLFVTFAMFTAFFMQGRGFGRPVPLPQEIKRRGAMEHVTGIANLSRRAGHRSAVMAHYHDQIKRKLGHRYRLDPGMNDDEYVKTLAGYNPSLDKDGLLNLLKRLKRTNISESEMVHLAVEASKWIDD